MRKIFPLVFAAIFLINVMSACTKTETKIELHQSQTTESENITVSSISNENVTETKPEEAERTLSEITPDCAEAFRSYINSNGKVSKNATFELVAIDEDSVPELIISLNNYGNAGFVAFYKDSVIYDGYIDRCTDLRYAEFENLIYSSYEYMNDHYDETYTYFSNNVIMSNTGVCNSDRSDCEWNGKKVTKDEYFDKLGKTTEFLNKTIGEDPEKVFSYDEFMTYLETISPTPEKTREEKYLEIMQKAMFNHLDIDYVQDDNTGLSNFTGFLLATLLDFNDDGIEELVLITNSSDTGNSVEIEIWTENNGEIILVNNEYGIWYTMCWGAPAFMVYKNTNNKLYLYDRNGPEQDLEPEINYVTLNGECFSISDAFRVLSSGTERTYFLNGEQVSREAYNNAEDNYEVVCSYLLFGYDQTHADELMKDLREETSRTIEKLSK